MRGCRLLATAALALPVSLNAQGTTGTIAGQVLGPNGNAVAEATVRLAHTGLLTLSDALGRFALDGVPVGERSVSVEALGFRPTECERVRVSGGEVTGIVVPLTSGTTEDRVTAACRQSETLAGTPRTRREVFPDPVASMPVDELRDLVDLLPGVADAGASLGPVIRGSSPGEAVYLLNGIPVRSMRSGAIPIRYAGLTSLAELALIPDPSAEFGDGYGGLVNLVTKTGSDHLETGFRYTTDGPLGKGVAIGFNRVEGSIGGPVASGVRFYANGVIQGSLGAARGDGVENVPAFVTAGIDTIVDEDVGGFTESRVIPRFAQFNGSCDASANFDVACQGRRLPLATATLIGGVGVLDVPYRSGTVSFTAAFETDQQRSWPGRYVFDPAAYQGVRTATTVTGISWRHEAWRRATQRLTLEATVSYQAGSQSAGPLDPEWELQHRSPFGGITLSPMQFLVNPDRFSSDTGQYAVTRLRSSEDWDQLVENFVYQRPHVPYQDHFELGAVGWPRVNPWGVTLSFPTEGPSTGEPDVELSNERATLEKLVVDWRSSAAHRLRVGAEHWGGSARSFRGGLVRTIWAQVYTAGPRRTALFATDRVRAGRLSAELGLRWERYNVGARFPIVPGRIYTNPAFDPADPSSLDSMFTASATHRALLPSVALGLRAASGTNLRLSWARRARMPDLDRMLANLNSDLGDLPLRATFGWDVDWAKADAFEVGVRQSFGKPVALDVSIYRTRVLSGLVFGAQQVYDPLSGRIENRNAFANQDVRTVWGGELGAQVSPTRQVSGLLSYSYQHPGSMFGDAQTRVHTLTAVLRYLGSPHAGGARWYDAVVGNLDAVATVRLTSGLPYTRYLNNGEGVLAPGAPIPNVIFLLEPLNASRLPWVNQVDLRFAERVHVGGMRWRIFADARNVLNVENVLRLFAETGETQNEEHHLRFVDAQMLTLEQDARGSGMWTGDGVDLSGDCSAWAGGGGTTGCVALRRAEARWGNGDGVLATWEFRSAVDAVYDLLYGRWTLLGASRQIRVGLDVAF